MTDTWFWVAFAALICALAAIIALYFRTIVPMKKLRDLTARLDSSDAEALRRTFPELPLHVVRGNCDILGNTPERLVIELGPVKAFCTHGHLYSVDWSFDYLVYAAQEAGAKLALCGHTHEAANLEIGGVQVLNPGTAGKGRTLSCGLVTVFDNGGIACEIRPL